jgi:hypothetical protein
VQATSETKPSTSIPTCRWLRLVDIPVSHSLRTQPQSCKASPTGTRRKQPYGVLRIIIATNFNMDQQRGRSPSAGHQQNHISRGPSPAPQFQDNASVGLGLALDPTLSDQNQNFLNSNFNNAFMGQQQNQPFTSASLTDPAYATSQDFTNQPHFVKQEEPSPFAPPQRSFTQELLSSNFNEGDFSLFSNPGQSDQFAEQSFFMNDPSQAGNINPTELEMSSPPNHAASPPGLLPPGTRSPPSAHQSPSFNQGAFQPSPGHSRNASLGPESAAFPQGHQQEWSMMAPQFTTHRRTPSEFSDVSVHSASHSPNLGHHDTFEAIEQQRSPMQQPQDHLYPEVLGIQNFSLSDQIPSPHRGLSPAHSPAISPRLVPQQMSNPNNNFMLGLNNGLNNGFGQPQGMYGQQNQESFPQMHGNSMDLGQAPLMTPPTIEVDYAPVSRQNSFEPPKPSLDQDALTPPDRGMSNSSLISLLC